MMIDAFLPEGVTELAVDSIFMMPQLGVLADRPRAGGDRGVRPGLPDPPRQRASRRSATARTAQPLHDGARSKRPGGRVAERECRSGDMTLLPLPADGETGSSVTVEPARGLRHRRGQGQAGRRARVRGGVVGLILDGRGRRPFELPDGPTRSASRSCAAWNQRASTSTRANSSAGRGETNMAHAYTPGLRVTAARPSSGASAGCRSRARSWSKTGDRVSAPTRRGAHRAARQRADR